MSVPVTTRLDESVVEALDRAVAAGLALNRGSVIAETSSFHGHVAEVALSDDEGLDHGSAANCDNLFTLPKTVLTRRRGRLSPTKLVEFDRALTIVLGLS